MRNQALALLGGLLLLLLAPAHAVADEPDTRAQLRRSVGNLEARAAETRVLVREHVNERGAQLEAFRDVLVEERIPALEHALAELRIAVASLSDDEVRGGQAGVELSVEACWPKWKRWLSADKYLFRASIRTNVEVELRSISVREPANGDIDIVRVPPSTPRDDGKPGAQYEIYDSFKIWGSEAELVIEDASGTEHVRAFECD